MLYGSLSALLPLALVLQAVALPQPKLPSIKSPRLRTRPAVANFVINAAENSTASNDTATPSVVASKENIWITLTNAEAAGVVSYLHNQSELNLTDSADAGTWDNMISVIDLLPPNKTAALKYMAGTGPKPPRYARATLMFGATEEPYLEDFIVGPLPVTNETTYVPDDWTTTKGTSKIRNFDADSDLTSDLWYSIAADADDIITDLLGANSSTFDIWGIDPLWQETDEEGKLHIVNWVGFWGIPDTVFDGETLLPQGLYFKVDQTGRDPSNWFLVGWLYQDIYYTSTAEFRAAWKNGDVVKATKNEAGDWIGTDRVGDELKYDDRAPPMQIQPSGQRFAVDADQKFVEWMDFSFYITFTRDTGVRLYDIKYKGERIIYELGLQEAIAHYAGNDPVQSGTAYLDTFYGFGPYAFNLLPGYDCPGYATYLNATFHANEVSTTHKNGICLYESDPGYLMQRHSNQNYLASTKNPMFTLRSVSTVGNYDYSFSYNFFLDGTIETEVKASGYIQSAFYAKNGEYGYKIHDGLSGSMHDHCLNWKLDMDILGQENTLALHTVKAVDVKYPWSNTTRSTMKLVRSEITNEDEGKLDWSENAQTMVVVVNKNETNPYGEPRGYRLMPSRGGGMHLTIKNSSNLFDSQGFATHGFYVLKHHDSEQKSAHANNDYDPKNPIIDFSKYFNSENLEQEDLVIYFNLGMHHVPHTGDLPNTVHTTAQASLMISPHNYLLNDPSRQSNQMVRVNYNSTAAGEGQVTDVLLFGGELPSGTIDLSSQQTSFYDYVGDVAVRKRPYDPLHPYNETESIV
ncbi:copper amine oxidase [Meredithblackwellia eburnea MCA 4105]